MPKALERRFKMRNNFDRELENLNEELTNMGILIEKAISNAVKALVEQNADYANAAIEYDKEVDQKEKDIESLCLKLLLQQQPVAKDLRLISSALKMITDMERIGDQASDIAEIVCFTIEKHHALATEFYDILKMAKATINMVNKSIDAYVKKDLLLAKSVYDDDDIVDNLFSDIRNDLIDMIRSDPKSGERALDLLMIAKYFERIGDHATNIAEWVVFSITGEHESAQ